ncbi:type III-A CRISPR-associated protein Cas10/Csm1 [Hydrogenivirga sp. 128-5-R1-1]|uniref:type III-A CRISPR-associated protein Cas10/Csm1 n=1 Tax=Hydrogenivirga sp. 128-5-R1-1 TaxID=392423 RepID=UPI00015F17B4|nr:type III-A CRISPR-associated protein Cas10/Csm1 [Hydrogenivirga sp. 128-5-R1-1]EDP76114.1 hypothetical protein HG1285_18129 [Hydrogenivirga sp. 128-5-R1-1]
MRERLLIALGGLLHDIGKFLQRARDNGYKFGDESIDEKLNQRSKEVYENDYKYEHAYLSTIVFEWLQQKGIIQEEEKLKLINWGAKHHKPTNELESIVCQIADWYSSSEREARLRSHINLLHSVFERISLAPKEDRKIFEEYAPETTDDLGKDITKSFGFYDLTKLKAGTAIFPIVFKGGFIRQGQDLIIQAKYSFKDHEGNYKELFENFLKEFELLESIKNNFEQLFNAIYYLLYKYTWCVPASTYDTEAGSRHYPDISLFDHSRVLSAIALSIYDWAVADDLNVENIKPKKVGSELKTDEEEVFLLVEGDIGGIQKFIYNIHKASDSRLSIAKALRGRSFFLTMLPEVIARYILKELNYPITNALFIGGGKFQLLVGNTKNNLRKLEEIEKEVNKWFFEDFHGELSLSIATVKMRGEVFRDIDREGKETFLDKVEQLQLELDRKKKRRFRKLIWDGEFVGDQTEAESICNSCRSLPVVQDKLCEWCNNSQKWGEVLPKVKYIAFDFGEDNIDVENRKVMSFGDFGKVYLLEDKDLPKVKDLPEVLNIENTDLEIESDKVVNGFKFIGHSAPRVNDQGLANWFNELWKRKKEELRSSEFQDELKSGHILPFELLAEFAEGDKKLGFFRADVDYLGLILSDGLRFNEFGTEEIYTISRIATLSRMLDLFFAGYLNKLAEEVSSEYVKRALEEYKDIEKDRELTSAEKERKELLEKVYGGDNAKLKVGSLIYTVYSGGDDLFVIAPYDLAVEFALRLRGEFKRFTCENPDFGISGGIYIGRHNTPIHLVARFAEDLEGTAKNQRIEKDMIAIFDKALLWNAENDSEQMKGVWACMEDNSKNNDFINIKALWEERGIVNKMVSWLKNGKVARGLYYKLLQLHKDFVHMEDGDYKIDPRIYPKIYYYIGRNVKDESVRNELIDTLLNGVGGKLGAKAVISNLDVILYLVLMKTRGGR